MLEFTSITDAEVKHSEFKDFPTDNSEQIKSKLTKTDEANESSEDRSLLKRRENVCSDENTTKLDDWDIDLETEIVLPDSRQNSALVKYKRVDVV